MVFDYTELRIIYENCEMSVVPHEEVKFFFFNGIDKQVHHLDGPSDDATSGVFGIDEFFKSGAIVLKPEAGETPICSFSEHDDMLLKQRVTYGDITQFHFYNGEELVASYAVDYEPVSNALGAPNVNQMTYTNEDGEICIEIREALPTHLIKVKYHSKASRPIEQAHVGEWCDLRAGYDMTIKAGERALIDLGVSIQVPPKYEAITAPRSSTFKNFGILQTNSIGVIDNKYCGNDDVWKFPCYAIRDTEIKAGDRIAQFRILPSQGSLAIVEVEDMGTENRGGLGSTGIR